MNIYLINEDGVQFCIRAKTMGQATVLCEQSYLEDLKEEKKDNYDESSERDYYYDEILQSCSLVGQLKN